jgi:hypothetical protein
MFEAMLPIQMIVNAAWPKAPHREGGGSAEALGTALKSDIEGEFQGINDGAANDLPGRRALA